MPANQQQFNALPKISSETNKKQAEFTGDVANFKEVQKQAEQDELRNAANDLLKHHSPDLGDRISETEIKSKKVPTPESYTKQKLFTELRESNKDSLDKK